MFGNNGATQNNMFNNPNANPNQNLFGQQPMNNSNNSMGNNLQQQPQGQNQGLFGNQGNQGQNNLFGNNNMQPQNNLFGNNQQPQTNLFGNMTQPGNNVNQNQGLPSNMPNNFFDNPLQGSDPVQDIMERQNNLNVLMNYKPGSLKSQFSNQINAMTLSNNNTFKDMNIQAFNSDEFKNTIVFMLERFIMLKRSSDDITQKQREVNDLLETCHRLAVDKIKVYKESYLEISAHSGLIEQLKVMLDKIDRLVGQQFMNFCQGLKNHRNIYVSKPSIFELELSDMMLKQCRQILETLTEYEQCQDQSGTSTLIQVVAGLVDYYKNVTCLVFQFREKYRQAKQEIYRRKSGIGAVVEQKLAQSTQSSFVFDRLYQIERVLDKMTKRLPLLKEKTKIQVD